MNDGTPEPGCCSVCGGPTRRSNTVGICRMNPKCRRANDEVRRRASGASPRRPRQICRHPDGCPEFVSNDGLCPMHYSRFRNTGQLGPVGRLRQPDTVKAGDTYGSWTVLEDTCGGETVRCRCACGRERPVLANTIKHGLSKSCGCTIGRAAAAERRLAAAKANPYVRAGERFGMLTALEDAPYSITTIAYRCECGREKRTTGRNLRRALKSCGHTRGAALSVSKQTHGLSKHPLYGTWYNIVRRTTDPGNKSYRNYGGRGIRIYGPWLTDVAAFIDWVTENLGPRPAGCSLDRIDNDSHYRPGNLQWASKHAQSLNRRTIRQLTQERDTLLAKLQAAQASSVPRKGSVSNREQPAMEPLF